MGKIYIFFCTISSSTKAIQETALAAKYGAIPKSGASERICDIAERPHQPRDAEIRKLFPFAKITPLPISKNAAASPLTGGKSEDMRQVTAEKNTILAETDIADEADEATAEEKDNCEQQQPPMLFSDLKKEEVIYAETRRIMYRNAPCINVSDAASITKAGLGRQERDNAFCASSAVISPCALSLCISFAEAGMPDKSPVSTAGNKASDRHSRFHIRSPASLLVRCAVIREYAISLDSTIIGKRDFITTFFNALQASSAASAEDAGCVINKNAVTI